MYSLLQEVSRLRQAYSSNEKYICIKPKLNSSDNSYVILDSNELKYNKSLKEMSKISDLSDLDQVILILSKHLFFLSLSDLIRQVFSSRILACFLYFLAYYESIPTRYVAKGIYIMTLDSIHNQNEITKITDRLFHLIKSFYGQLTV
jgi:hypothetical protein